MNTIKYYFYFICVCQYLNIYIMSRLGIQMNYSAEKGFAFPEYNKCAVKNLLLVVLTKKIKKALSANTNIILVSLSIPYNYYWTSKMKH